MSDRARFDERWERLVRAARRASAPRPAADPGWVERMARRGLRARTVRPRRAPEPLAWAGLSTLAAVAAGVVLLLPGPLHAAATAAARRISSLPHLVPHAPRLPPAPAAPRPALPRPEATLAAVARWPELNLDLPFPSHRTDTP